MKTPAIPDGDLLAGPDDQRPAAKALAVSDAESIRVEVLQSPTASRAESVHQPPPEHSNAKRGRGDAQRAADESE